MPHRRWPARRSPLSSSKGRSELREHLKGHSEALESLAIEVLARGLSVRDIEGAFKDESGRLLLSRTAVSELGERLWADYQEIATRDLSEHDIVYLFVDGIGLGQEAGGAGEVTGAGWVDPGKCHAGGGERVAQVTIIRSGGLEQHETALPAPARRGGRDRGGLKRFAFNLMRIRQPERSSSTLPGRRGCRCRRSRR